ncbi:MAG: 3-deoxy-7-phosphoheptulonate synthase [Deltaproteobacteria bacterium]
MIITIQPTADPKKVKRTLVELGVWADEHVADGRVVLTTNAHSTNIDAKVIEAIEGVASVATKKSPHPLLDAQPRTIEIGAHKIGVDAPRTVIAGPCSVESEDSVRRIAGQLAPLGVSFLRGGAFKPRTSPYAFRGHGDEALRWLARAAHDHGMGLITELMSEYKRDEVAEFADLIQIGSRNMHNYALLEHAAGAKKPIFLKRGMSATVEEWLSSAEYCLMHGAPAVVFCERGIRSFDPSTRNLVDLGAVALVSHVYGQPVIVDPSHGTGRKDLVEPLARAALAAGAHGVMVEAHDRPSDALSDGPQAVSIDTIAAIAAYAKDAP